MTKQNTDSSHLKSILKIRSTELTETLEIILKKVSLSHNIKLDLNSVKAGVFPFTDKEPEKDVEIKLLCQKYITNKISDDGFQQKLRNQGVNLGNEHIVKAINDVKRGETSSFTNLYSAISLYKNE